MLCYSAVGLVVVTDWQGPGTLTPRVSRSLTHCHVVMESASHHSNPNATAHFHGLAGKPAIKAGKPHLLSWVFQYLKKKKPTERRIPSKLHPEKARERPSRKSWRWNIIAGPVIWSLSCFVLAAVVFITAPLSRDRCRLSFLTNVSFLVRLHSGIRWLFELEDTKDKSCVNSQ